VKNVNVFELVVDTRVEKLDGKIREVSQRIKIDDVEINQQYAVCLSSLIESLHVEGEHYIFTCGCGSSGCAGIQEGVNVTFAPNTVIWKIRDPISTSGYENLNHWISNSKVIEYEFNKTDMIEKISVAIDKIKNNVNEYTVFSPYTLELKQFLQLDSKILAN
jgi:hypothetical protein